MMKSLLTTSLFLLFITFGVAQKKAPGKAPAMSNPMEQPSNLVDFDAFERLTAEVKPYRKKRLVKLDRFLELAQKPNTIILDTRSDRFYNARHIKGAKHLNFADFTMSSLAETIPGPETTILIYCNNNIAGDDLNFPSKSFVPPTAAQGMQDKTAVTLALNIPTFINLYGYGYRNIYELESLIQVYDPRLKFEGSDVLIINSNK